MNPHEYAVLHLFHVMGALLLIGFTFYAFAAPAAARKKVMIWTGVGNLLILLTGIRMWQGLYSFSGGWVIVKLVAWLALAAFAGVAFRKREKAGALMWMSVALSFLAVVMVYTKPF
ncbi:MAG TPA: hypothetical protein PLN52_15870 [Opitutaceae bacterium]|nr:hypothetical protein [Opitutaceae bacterium]